MLYNDKAREAGVYVVGSCGWGSITVEAALAFARQKFNGRLPSRSLVLAVIYTYHKRRSSQQSG